MAPTEIAALIGVGLAAAAYLPQIAHLIKERCSAGISRIAFATWLISSLLITVHAVATHADVFVLLGVVQLGSTVVILMYATRYRGQYCAIHLPHRLVVGSTEPSHGERQAELSAASRASDA